MHLTHLDKAVSDLFDQYGPDAILAALADRMRDESAIAAGEGRSEDARTWMHRASEIDPEENT